MPDDSKWIHNATDDQMEQEVFARSHQVPVIVDFWAEWCQPCLMLGPLLEELVESQQGQVELVKANVDQCQQSASQFQVNGIPAVFGVVNGEVVDFFEGLLPKPQLEAWIQRLGQSGKLLEAGRLEADDPQAAEEAYRQGHQQNPNDASYAIGLARVLLAQDQAEEAGEMINQLERRGFLEPEAEKLKAQLELGQGTADDLPQRKAAAEAEPDNLQLQWALAEGLAADQQYEEALQICLELVQKDRAGIGDQARLLMIDVFRVLPDDSELTGIYRRKLSSALY